MSNIEYKYDIEDVVKFVNKREFYNGIRLGSVGTIKIRRYSVLGNAYWIEFKTKSRAFPGDNTWSTWLYENQITKIIY